MRIETTLHQLSAWIETELKLDGYEHKAILDKISSLLIIEQRQIENAFVAGLAEMQKRNALFPSTAMNKGYGDYFIETYNQ